MYSLFIDTHDEYINIVLFKDGKVLDEKHKLSQMQHSVFTMPLIDEIINSNNLDIKDVNEILVVNGPGSFTGVRIGVTISKTLAFCLNIPIKVINVLKMKAIMIDKDNKIVSVLEKNGAYVAKYSKTNDLIDDYFYLKKDEYEKYLNENDIELVEDINYEKVYEYLKTESAINPHAVNPLYIKTIEVLK